MRPVRFLAPIAFIAQLLLVQAACNGGEGEDTLETVDLGAPSVDEAGGQTGPIEVELPAGTTSALAYCGDFGDAALGAVWGLTDPAGELVWNGDAPGGPWRSDFLDDMAPGLLPLSPELPASEGIWLFDWYVEGFGGAMTCEAVIRSGLGDDVGGDATVNVDLVFVGGELTAATAPDDADFQAALDTFTAEWGEAGLTVEFGYEDFTGDAGRFAVVDVTDDDYSEFNDLLRTASPADDRTITFFLVEEIANGSDGGATILGLAGGPPGASTFSGTSKSGVIVSSIDFRSAPDDVGKIMAHEGGHFLGLFHTTERDGSNTDLLGDTPVCDTDTNGNGTLNSDECGGAGADNVMWWTLTSGNATMSADQGWVVRRNPVAY